MASFLPDWGVNVKDSGLSWLWRAEDGDDDGALDDDNVFEDDNEIDSEEGEEESEEADNSSAQSILKKKTELTVKLKIIRGEMEDNARKNNGKVDPKLMAKYQKLSKKRRKVALKQREMAKYDSLRLSNAYKGRASRAAEAQQERAAYRRAGRRKYGALWDTWKPPGHNTTDYTKLPLLPMDERVLPDMSQTGGVIFFLHVPKTVRAIQMND